MVSDDDILLSVFADALFPVSDDDLFTDVFFEEELLADDDGAGTFILCPTFKSPPLSAVLSARSSLTDMFERRAMPYHVSPFCTMYLTAGIESDFVSDFAACCKSAGV